MSALVDVRGRGRPSGATEPGRVATLRAVSDELYLSGATSTRLSPFAIRDIERKALNKIRRAMGSICGGLQP